MAALASPTPSPIPATNFMPVFLSNTWSYEGGTPTSYYNNTGITMPTLSATCSSSLGSFGDYQSIQYILPYVDMVVPGQTSLAILDVSKNTSGDLYAVGYENFPGPTITCVKPFPIARATMKASDTWTFQDILGFTRVATVVYARQPSSFVVSGNGPHGGQSVTYPSVTEVTYGPDQTIWWGADIGPVQIQNSTSLSNFPATLTLYDSTISPASK